MATLEENKKIPLTVGVLKEVIKTLPDDMSVGLVDLTTDDFYDSSYQLTKASIGPGDCAEEEDGPVTGQALWISFENKLNENPI